ncbi:MAG TPA: TonB-dependent receptor, partial [Chitinophagaceae bacterium]
ALLYGSEAIGGVLNIIEEQPAADGTKESDINIGTYSNTLGASVDGGFRFSKENKSWGLRGGVNSNADYTDGESKRIRNSRFAGYYLKAFRGWQHGKWTSMNHFTSSLDNFGFITEDNANSFLRDGRWSRSMGGPHHTVLLNVLSSENSIRLQHSELDIDGGIQSNLRMENEGDHKVSLNMLLSTLLWRVMWKKMVKAHTEVILSNNSQFENNTNFGSRIIIPDADLFESGFSGFLRHHMRKCIIEAGVGASVRSIHTMETAGVNTPDKSIRPFDKTKPSLNGSVGVALNPSPAWTLKANASTGFRSGNLAELSSDGLHEGTLRYEIGDPNLKIEQNVMGEVSIAWHSGSFEATANLFYNRFFNYIYLDPAGTTFLGFEVFRFRQFDASLAGSEDRIAMDFPGLGMMHVESNFSTVRGKLAGGANLPFIPPSRWRQELRYPWHAKTVDGGYAFVNVTTTYAQERPAEFETPTAGHTLVNAGIGGSVHMTRRTITINISGNNLLNKNYYDHLSRFKDYGIHNIGRNIVVHVHIPLDNHLKIKS